ncbi:hypothetical protein N2152v2_003895 [Parachlorella kessleri]
MLKQTLLTLAVITAHVCTAQPTQLTDDSFEAVTQAATGQTTGVWVVKFCSDTHQVCRDVKGGWDRLATELLDQQIFLAEVDTDKSPQLTKRFHIRKHPTILLFRNQKMYVFPATAVSDMMVGLRLFVTSGYESAHATAVPPTSPGLLEHLFEAARHLGYIGTVAVILAMLGIFASLGVAIAKPKTD